MKRYGFYGWETADLKDANGLTPRDYYDILSGLWCADTCAPRMRDEGIRIKKGKSERNKKRFPIPYTLRKHFFCNLIALFSAELLKIIQ